jgi:ADP-ribose pyrophosphatase YjhB (NUDIX family)
MNKASRAIIMDGDRILVMRRNKYGSEYYTLVGGRVNEGEGIEQALVREVKEESGLDVTAAQLVFVEEHPEPYNEQYTFLCAVAPFEQIGLQEMSEEYLMNRHQANMHTVMWARVNIFERLPFRTPQLQEAIVRALKKGFPKSPVKL